MDCSLSGPIGLGLHRDGPLCLSVRAFAVQSAGDFPAIPQETATEIPLHRLCEIFCQRASYGRSLHRSPRAYGNRARECATGSAVERGSIRDSTRPFLQTPALPLPMLWSTPAPRVPEKYWTAEGWAQVIDFLRAEHGFVTVLTGSQDPHERDHLLDIKSHLGQRLPRSLGKDRSGLPGGRDQGRKTVLRRRHRSDAPG